MPHIFQGIFYLAKTISLPQYILHNHSLKSGMYVVTPTGPEDMKEEMALAVLVSTVVYIQNDKLLS